MIHVFQKMGLKRSSKAKLQQKVPKKILECEQKLCSNLDSPQILLIRRASWIFARRFHPGMYVRIHVGQPFSEINVGRIQSAAPACRLSALDAVEAVVVVFARISSRKVEESPLITHHIDLLLCLYFEHFPGDLKIAPPLIG